MAEVLFYHLTRSKLEEALPQLLLKTMERGWKAVLQGVTLERIEALDEHLWTFREESFLPHGRVGGPREAEQPLLLTIADDNPNGATVRFFVEGAVPESDLGAYERCVVMFDGEDETQLAAARGAWKALKGGEDTVTYWQQTPQGGWKEVARG